MPAIDDTELTARVGEILNRWPAVGLAVGVVRDGSLESFHAQNGQARGGIPSRKLGVDGSAVMPPHAESVLTAKSYGSTNLIAVDRNGTTLSNSPILVVGPSDEVVVVYRGVERETYSCMPNCERRITIGDSAGYFTANLGQVGTFGAQAQGSAPK